MGQSGKDYRHISMKVFIILPALLAYASGAAQLLVRGAGQTSHQSVSKPFQGEHRSTVQSKAFGAAVASVSDSPNRLHGARSVIGHPIAHAIAHPVAHAAPAYAAPAYAAPAYAAPVVHAAPAYAAPVVHVAPAYAAPVVHVAPAYHAAPVVAHAPVVAAGYHARPAGQVSHQSVSKPYQGEHRSTTQSKAFGASVAAVVDSPNRLHGAHSVAHPVAHALLG